MDFSDFGAIFVISGQISAIFAVAVAVAVAVVLLLLLLLLWLLLLLLLLLLLFAFESSLPPCFFRGGVKR